MNKHPQCVLRFGHGTRRPIRRKEQGHRKVAAKAVARVGPPPGEDQPVREQHITASTPEVRESSNSRSDLVSIGSSSR